MPLPGTHTARQRAPGGCDKVRQDADKFGPGVTPLWCVKGGKVTVESIHFSATKFTPEEARDWLKKHGYKTDQFEEAAKETKAAAGPGLAAAPPATPPAQTPPGPPDLADPPDGAAEGEGCYPEPGEALGAFMGRCMTDPNMMAGHPDEAGRHAACEVCWEKAHPPVVPATAAEGPLLKCAGGAGLEILAAPGDGGPPRFGLVAYTGVPMKLDGYFHPVIVDLESLKTPRQALPVLRQHDPERIAGHTDSVDVSAQRIKAGGVLSGMADHTADVLHTAKGGFPWQASIGANPQRMEFVPKGEGAKVNGRNWSGPLFVARGATLREISLVPMGADGNTSAAVAAAAAGANGAGTENGGRAMEFNDWLASIRLDRSTLDGEQLKSLEASWRAQYEPEERPNKPVGTASIEEIVTAGRNEATRQQKITEMVAQAINEYPGNVAMIATAEALGRAAIEGKWDTQRAELEFLRARRPHGPGLAIPSGARGQPVDAVVLECAVSKRAGLDNLEKVYPVPVLEAAERHFGRGLTLCELVGKYAERGGFRGHSVRSNLEAAWRAAKRAGDWGEQPPELRAAGSWGPSTQGASIGSLLANVANKFFRAAFEAVDNSWRQISARRSANDFKQITTYSLTGDLTFKKLPPGGEIQHGQVDATSYTNQVDTFARMLGLDRRDLVNDDLGAFASIARRLGRGGAIALNKLFWGEFLNNSAFFTSGRNNLITGAGTTLQLSQLDALNQKFLTQTDPDGNILGVMPRILLVPPALAVTAQTLMSSTLIVSGATTTGGVPNANVWAGKFQVVTSPYMQDSTLTGNSSTAWYLLADPADLPVIEVAFLNGAETPTVEQADADVSMLGQAFRGYFDIGCAKQEYRGGAKSAGA